MKRIVDDGYKTIFLQRGGFLVKKVFIVLVLIEMVIGTVVENPVVHAVYASKQLKGEERSGNTENFKTEFAYEIAQFTAKIVSMPNEDIEKFKMEFAYRTFEVTTKVMPIIPNEERNVFAYEMAQITTKIISDKTVDIEKAKNEFAYEIAKLTTKIIMNTDSETISQGNANYSPSKGSLLRNNADIEQKPTIDVKNHPDLVQNDIASTSDIAPTTYHALIDELMNVSDDNHHAKQKLNIDGELRLHYAFNSGAKQLEKDSSGVRVRLGFDTEFDRDWHAYGMLEGKQNLVNYNNEFKLLDLYVTHKNKETMVKAGAFGYLMADGNIYDSTFKGVRSDFNGPVSYTVSFGKTDYTKKTVIATATYHDYDYNVETGVYHYQTEDSKQKRNTIVALGGDYNFSNFGVEAMVLHSSLKDSKGNNNGYVVGLKYGDLKTYRPGSYDVFVKYYNQPVGTYISHGMNGRGNSMEGFKGYGIGVNYTFAENFVAGLEHYNLVDKVTGEDGNTLWSYVTYYF